MGLRVRFCVLLLLFGGGRKFRPTFSHLWRRCDEGQGSEIDRRTDGRAMHCWCRSLHSEALKRAQIQRKAWSTLLVTSDESESRAQRGLRSRLCMNPLELSQDVPQSPRAPKSDQKTHNPIRHLTGNMPSLGVASSNQGSKRHNWPIHSDSQCCCQYIPAPVCVAQVANQPDTENGDVSQKVTQRESVPKRRTDFSYRLRWLLCAHRHTQFVAEGGDALCVDQVNKQKPSWSLQRPEGGSVFSYRGHILISTIDDKMRDTSGAANC